MWLSKSICLHLDPADQLQHPSLTPKGIVDGIAPVRCTDETDAWQGSGLQAACMLYLALQNPPEQLLACSLQVHLQLFLAGHICGADEHGWKSMDRVLQFAWWSSL